MKKKRREREDSASAVMLFGSIGLALSSSKFLVGNTFPQGAEERFVTFCDPDEVTKIPPLSPLSNAELLEEFEINPEIIGIWLLMIHASQKNNYTERDSKIGISAASKPLKSATRKLKCINLIHNNLRVPCGRRFQLSFHVNPKPILDSRSVYTQRDPKIGFAARRLSPIFFVLAARHGLWQWSLAPAKKSREPSSSIPNF